jgi:heme exporter protein C
MDDKDIQIPARWLKLVSSTGKMLGLFAVLSGVYAGLRIVQVPADALQGVVQKIFYLHVSSAWATYSLVFCAFVLSIFILWRDSEGYGAIYKPSIFAGAAVEVALVFLTIVNITGPIWAKPIWGTWWSWDARLTTNFVLWLLLVVYVILRNNLPADVRRERIGSVLVVLATINIPIVHYSVNWWRTLHPEPVVMQEKVGGGLDDEMKIVLLVSLVAMTFLCGALWMFASYALARKEAYEPTLEGAES